MMTWFHCLFPRIFRLSSSTKKQLLKRSGFTTSQWCETPGPACCCLLTVRAHSSRQDFDLVASMRENSRDIWAQKNNTCVVGEKVVKVGCGVLVVALLTLVFVPQRPNVEYEACCCVLLRAALIVLSGLLLGWFIN